MTSLRPLAVVEDNDEDFEALSRALRDTTSADAIERYETGEAALQGLRGNAVPALILLDLNLPGMLGLDVLRVLKASAQTRLVPVIVLSGSSRQEDVDAAYAAGANAYLAKPLDFPGLRRTVTAMHDFWRNAALPRHRP